MRQFWRFFTVLVGPGIILMFALAGYAAFDVYARGNCDIKFGCAGSVQFAATLATLTLLCSSLGHLPAYLIFRESVRHLRIEWLLITVAFLGLGQFGLYVAMIRYLPLESLTSILGTWVVVSAILAAIALAIARRWLPNNSFKPTPLRGAA